MAGRFDDLVPAAQPAQANRFADLIPAAQQRSNRLIDVLRSIPGGLAKGAAGVAGLPGDLASLNREPQTGLENSLLGRLERAINPANVLPSGQQISEGIGQAVGGYYKPQTTEGQYAETISEFAPLALAPGGALRRAASVLVPGALSEAAGQWKQGTPAEPYARLGGAILGTGGVAAAPAIGRIGSRMLNRGIAAAGGKEFLNPDIIARERLAAAVNREGGTPALQQNVQNWAASGASDPALLDVTGNNTGRLLRAAASGTTGEAQNIATQYAKRIAGNLQDRAAGLTRALTPGRSNSAASEAKRLEDLRGNLASTDYPPAYAEPAVITRELVSALQGREGRAAISRAMAAASANRDTTRLGELQALWKVASEHGADAARGGNLRLSIMADALAKVSAGTVDRVRIAMRGIGQNLSSGPKPAKDIARGYFRRVEDIDSALDQTPGLLPARQQYRDLSQQIEAVDTGLGAMNTPSVDYRAASRAMNPEALAAAQIGHRQALLDAIERPAAGATGALNRISTGTQQGENLGASFGPDVAGRYRAGIGNEMSRLEKGRFISPNTGSQTALRADELALVDAIPTSKIGILTTAVNALRNGLTLTDAQRASIVRLGTDERMLASFMRAMPKASPQHVAVKLLLSSQAASGARN